MKNLMRSYFPMAITLLSTSFPAMLEAGTAVIGPRAPAVPEAICATSFSSVRTLKEGVQLVRITEDLAVEKLTGDAALAHLLNLMSRKPEVFEHARRNAREKGWSATDTVYVERTIRFSNFGASRYDDGSWSPTDYSESNAEGEIVLWSSDDGNNNTWEGTIYMEIYSNGAAATWQGQIDASITTYPWIWYHKMWERPPIGQQGSLDEPPPLPGSLPGVTFAVLNRTTAAQSGYTAVGFYSWAKCWRACVVTGCGTAALGCIASGPGWPACFGWWCLGAEVSCGIGCYFGQ